MTGVINLLNVGDGDAIIAHLEKNGKDLVIVIDGGQPWHYENIVKPKLVELLAELKKPAPDIVVATHYDSDHIGGLIPLVEEYIDQIKEVWVHRSPELNEKEKSILEAYESQTRLNSYEVLALEHELIDSYPSIKEEAIRAKTSFIIKSIKQLRTFLGLLPSNKVRQVFHGYSYQNWPEIKVLGPTQEYYEVLFPSDKNLQQLIIEETIDFINESHLRLKKQNIELVGFGQNPCKLLKDETTARLTPTNKASIIIAIDQEDKRYLLTGDAGIESFKMIPDWKQELSNLYWLKIPHHGSDNNISKEIIEVMKPVYSDNSGDRYQDQPVLDCISKNPRSKRKARSTKTEGNIKIKL